MSAAGIVLALAITAGAVVGIFIGQPSAGLLTGLGLGVLGAILVNIRRR